MTLVFKEFFQEYKNLSVKQFESRLGLTFGWACPGFRTVCKDYQRTTLAGKELNIPRWIFKYRVSCQVMG